MTKAYWVCLPALVAITACGGGSGSATIPAFARSLPGHTALVLWGDAPLPGNLVEWVAQLAAWLKLTPLPALAEPTAVAFRSPETLPVGWSSLAGSLGFVAALARLREPAPLLLFLDLEQIVDTLDAAWTVEQETLRKRLHQSLRVRALRFLAVGLRPTATGFEGQGRLLTTGAERGVPGLLTTSLDAPVTLAEADPDLPYQLDAAFDHEVFRHMLRSAFRVADGLRLLGTGDEPFRLIDQVGSHVGGALSLRGRSWQRLTGGIAVDDAAGLRAAIERLTERAGKRGTPPPWLSIREGWAVVQTPGGPRWDPGDPATSRPATEPYWRLTLPLPWDDPAAEVRLSLELTRSSANEVGVRLSLGR